MNAYSDHAGQVQSDLDRQTIEAIIDALPENHFLDPPPDKKLKAIRLRKWTWPLTKPYNGFTPQERVRNWQMSWWLQNMGVLAKPSKCSICRSPRNVAYHSENYYNIFKAPQLCKSCHPIIHRRFSKSSSWPHLVKKYGDGTKWFEKLTRRPIDMAGYLRGIHGAQVRDLLNSPLYTLPKWLPRPASELYPINPS